MDDTEEWVVSVCCGATDYLDREERMEDRMPSTC